MDMHTCIMYISSVHEDTQVVDPCHHWASPYEGRGRGE